jgi:phosphoglucomutase
MNAHPLAGTRVPKDLFVDVDRLPPSTTRLSRTLRMAHSGSVSAPAVIEARRGAARSTRRTSWPSLSPSANTGSVVASPARSILERIPTLSEPAFRTALEVLAANGVETVIDRSDFRGSTHLRRIQQEAQAIIAKTLAGVMR